jgi:outer membrane protein OmpA-like peptidoglycan-associated protein
MRHCVLLFLCCLQSLRIFAAPADTSRWSQSAIRLNTEYDESHPILSADGQTLYFVRQNHPQNIGEEDKSDIWMSYRDSSGTWSHSVNIGSPLNNENDNKVVGINLSGEKLFLTGDANNKVFFSKYKNRTWSMPRELSIEGIANQSTELNCHVSIDEKYLLFALKNDSCVGERDLFVSIKNQYDVWSAPRSLGGIINTLGDEANVFLAADNKTLYFATNGREGLGGTDWYASRRLDDTWLHWTTPINLGNKINTNKNDNSFCINTELEECYGIKTNIIGGDSDIARFFLDDITLLPIKTVLIRGKVQLTNGEPVQTTVQLQSLAQKTVDNTIFSKSDGSFQFLISAEDKIGFYATDKDYFSTLAYVNLSKQPLKTLDADGTENAVGKDSLRLFNIEKAKIRINDINQIITTLEQQKPPVLDIKNISESTILSENNSYEVNQKLEKLRLLYNKKYNITDNTSYNSYGSTETQPKNYDNTSTTLKINATDDETPLVKGDEKVELMKKGFEEKKRLKETNFSNENASEKNVSTDAESLNEEDRQAISEISELHGIKYTNSFQDVVERTKRKLISLAFQEAKEYLQKEIISDWNSWTSLISLDNEETRKLNAKLAEIQKLIKQEFSAKNSWEQSQKNYSNITFDADEKEIVKELKKTIVDNVQSYARNQITIEVHHAISFRLYDELRQYHMKKLERLLNKHGNQSEKAENQPIIDTNLNTDLLLQEQQTHVTVLLLPLQKNITIPLYGIYFGHNTADILPDSEAELMRIEQLLKANPFSIVEITAHTHSYCNDMFAQLITQQRLENIKKYLLNNEVLENQILIRPYGKNAPLAPNNTLEGRLRNQRIEMKILTQ